MACEPRSPAELALDDGALAGVGCAPAGNIVDRVTLQVFADTRTLRDFWEAELDSLASPIEETDTACKDDTAGHRKWGFGTVACVEVDGEAQIRWTDQRTQVYGVATAADGNASQLFEWWRTTARPLGRPVEEGTFAPEEPAPSVEPGPLVRIPGAPQAITCDATGDPIADRWMRTWRVKNIEFLERRNYERVILNLVRTGRNRGGQPTQASIERMPVSRVPDAVPGASRPKRGRTAIVIRLDGIRQAPDLRRYRPSAMELARELSVVSGKGSRTVIISGPPDICYEMRIPVWGPSASGKERRAEIYIDLREKPNR